jgi:type I restriction enzyme S subunit
MYCAGGQKRVPNRFIKDFGIALPSWAEQQTIRRFLDYKFAQIDSLIAKKELLLKKLAQKRTALISHAVTKGLDPSAPMKDSGVPWLGEIPAHWQVTRLKYATSKIVDCPHETPIYSADGEFFVIETADITSGFVSFSAAYRVDEDEYLKRIRREPLLEGDIVYGREGERWGFAALVPSNPVVCLGQRMMQFRASMNFKPIFLMWQLNSIGIYKQGAVDITGATSPHVNVETIRNYLLAEPPPHEQSAIADYLDCETANFDAMTIKVKQAINKLKEYRTSLITHTVTGKIDVRHVPIPKLPEAEAA